MALEVDGMNVSTLLDSANISGVYHNQSAYQEMSYQLLPDLPNHKPEASAST
jgi:hypothetical protein